MLKAPRGLSLGIDVRGTLRASAAIALAALLVTACGDASSPRLASVSGDAIPFDDPPLGRIEGARIWVLERPDLEQVTGADGHFHLDGLEVGSEVTLVLDHPDYHRMQTGTHVVPEGGIERLTFQAVTHGIYAAFAAVVGVVPDEEHACQMPSTVTRVGKSMYDYGAHGEAGATVSIDPPLGPEHGPIYFNSSVVPDRSLSETSDDGGIVYVQVPPGEYVVTAAKPGVEFRQVKMKCRPGVLVNASPPWGLQALPST
jgi:hypothetical protein